MSKKMAVVVIQGCLGVLKDFGTADLKNLELLRKTQHDARKCLDLLAEVMVVLRRDQNNRRDSWPSLFSNS